MKVDEFTVGTTVFLNFKPTAGGRVNVNFSSDRSGEILLHFNARYDQRCLVLNTRRAEGGWEQEERPPGFPIETGMTALLVYYTRLRWMHESCQNLTFVLVAIQICSLLKLCRVCP